MNFNLNAFGSHPDSAENRGCIKDADFLGQIDALLGGNPTEEQLEEVRKTLVGTNKAWMPKWLFDDLVNVPAGPEPEPQQPNDEIWYTSNDEQIIELSQDKSFGDGITVVSNTYENGKGIIKLSGDATHLDDGVFYNKKNLIGIELPDSIVDIGLYVFNNCSNLVNIKLPNNITILPRQIFDSCTSLTSITIPDGVTTIGYLAFQRTQLTHVEIPNSVITIGERAFDSCAALTSINIPNNVQLIGDSAFQGCTGLTSIEIPNSVTSIGNSAFSSCTSLTSITIPDSVTSIGSGIVSGASNLTSAIIGSGVDSIKYGFFMNCKKLTNVTIANGVTCIGDQAFYGCSLLSYLEFPSSISRIEGTPFNQMSTAAGHYKTLIFNSIEPPTLTGPTTGSQSVFSWSNIYVPAGSVDTYKAASGWSNYANSIQAIPTE